MQGLLVLRRMVSGIMVPGAILKGPYDTDTVLGDGSRGDSTGITVLVKWPGLCGEIIWGLDGEWKGRLRF